MNTWRREAAVAWIRALTVIVCWLHNDTIVEARFVSLWMWIKWTLQTLSHSSFWVTLAAQAWHDRMQSCSDVLYCWRGVALTCQTTSRLILWTLDACRHPRIVAWSKRRIAFCIVIFQQTLVKSGKTQEVEEGDFHMILKRSNYTNVA